MANMIERVAEAMRLRSIERGFPIHPLIAHHLAATAIEAMREPTEDMIEASNREWDGRMSHRSSCAWQAMIDAALAHS